MELNTADEARARIENAVRQAEDNVARSRAMSDELDSLRVVGRSRNGLAEVTVTTSGALVDLNLATELEDSSLAEIRNALLQASADARVQASQGALAVAARHYGEGSKTVDQFEDFYTKMLRVSDAATGEGPDGDAGPGVLR